MKKIFFHTTITLLFLFATQIKAQDTIVGEFRGVWIATAKMLDFPSKRNMPSSELKKEFISIIEMHKKNGMNAIIFQVRPAADAFFESMYEPWSEWLTGKQGRPPSPYFDPLKFMVTETHKRGMEFHAWFNPFRAVATIEYADIVKNHISNTKKDWIVTYGINKYLNPGIPAVRHYVSDIIADVVKRYNIDGVHFDDYFYPYPIRDENKKIIPFPDYQTYKHYGKGFDNIADWRRHNMNAFIKEVNEKIKKIRPDIKFGVSPPAVWRNKSRDIHGSDTRGLAAYDWLYADILKWLANGWIDYVAPQLYFPIGHKAADFKTLVKWWNENTFGKHLYIGIGVFNTVNGRITDKNEIPNEIKLARKYKNVKGFIFYRSSSFKSNPLNINNILQQDLFANKAIPPEMPWLEKEAYNIVENTNKTDSLIKIKQDSVITNEKTPLPPFAITKTKQNNEIIIKWSVMNENEVLYFNIYKFKKHELPKKDINNRILVCTDNYFNIYRKKRIVLFGKKYKYYITSVGKNNKESDFSEAIPVKLTKYSIEY